MLVSAVIIVLGSLIPSFVSLSIPDDSGTSFSQRVVDAFDPNEYFSLWGGHAIPAIILAFVVGTRIAKTGEEKKGSELKEIACSCGMAGFFTVFFNYDIATSESSTATIGYIFLPMWTIVVIVLGMGLGKLLHYITRIK